jgi:hypothetical protein
VARSFWDGHGLTHHISEPHVFAFTSPVAQFVAIVGQSVGQGLAALRLASIAATVVALFFAHRICDELKMGWAARILLYAYLAMDHLQVFFGMGGMETQISTAVIVTAVYLFLAKRHLALGLMTGLAVLCRPELAIWPLVVGFGVLFRDGWLPALKTALFAAIVVLPWAGFATWYFGSPIPQSVQAKSVVFDRTSLFSIPLNVVWQYCLDWWKSISPFREYWIVSKTPVPDFVLQIIVGLVTLLALVGTVRAAVSDRRMLTVAAVVFVFAAYRTIYAIGVYFMWYLPPFVALFFLMAAYGLDWATKKAAPVTWAGGGILAAAYAIPVFIHMPLDRAMQRDIEQGVRWKVGDALNELMTKDDIVVLEPLGYLGWVAKDKTIYDYPGLGSRKSFEILRRVKSMVALVDDARPTFAVFRPGDYETFQKYIPDGAKAYTPVREISAREGLELSNLGLEYPVIDNHFTIYRLIPRIDLTFAIVDPKQPPRMNLKPAGEATMRSDGGPWVRNAVPNGGAPPVPKEMGFVTSSWAQNDVNTGRLTVGPIKIESGARRIAIPIIRGQNPDNALTLQVENAANGQVLLTRNVDTEWAFGWYWVDLDLRAAGGAVSAVQVTLVDSGANAGDWGGLGPPYYVTDGK